MTAGGANRGGTVLSIFPLREAGEKAHFSCEPISRTDCQYSCNGGYEIAITNQVSVHSSDDRRVIRYQ